MGSGIESGWPIPQLISTVAVPQLISNVADWATRSVACKLIDEWILSLVLIAPDAIDATRADDEGL
jgi:hypothetical protein